MLLDSLAGGISAGLENARTADISEICKVLGTDATLLEYFAIDEQIYVMVLSSKLFNITPVAKVAEIVQHLRMLEFQLSKFHLEPAYVTRFEAVLIKSCQAHLQALFRKLIAGIEHMLTTTRLVVVPHGQLHSLPFQALFDGKEYLIDRFSICHAPSASVFAYTHRSRIQNERPTSLVIGVDDPLMPSVKQEIEAVAKVLPRPKVLWGAEATEEHLLEYGATSSFIHIATHGSFRPDSPMFSAIRLADSYLTLYDLYRMNLPAEFLTLSGCVTGLNVVDKGDELMGLTRGLLYSGAQSLLLSLWDVDDKSTSEFMTAFYEGFSPAFPKADALRSAMLRIRERRPHPYHWAAFKLTGKAFA
jgi:CHAT domain-containing protein